MEHRCYRFTYAYPATRRLGCCFLVSSVTAFSICALLWEDRSRDWGSRQQFFHIALNQWMGTSQPLKDKQLTMWWQKVRLRPEHKWAVLLGPLWSFLAAFSPHHKLLGFSMAMFSSPVSTKHGSEAPFSATSKHERLPCRQGSCCVWRLHPALLSSKTFLASTVSVFLRSPGVFSPSLSWMPPFLSLWLHSVLL